jgi:hypothetical protein
MSGSRKEHDVEIQMEYEHVPDNKEIRDQHEKRYKTLLHLKELGVGFIEEELKIANLPEAEYEEIKQTPL